MKQKSRLWIWIIKQIPINYIFGIVEDAHKWQKQSLLHELEDGKSIIILFYSVGSAYAYISQEYENKKIELYKDRKF